MGYCWGIESDLVRDYNERRKLLGRDKPSPASDCETYGVVMGNGAAFTQADTPAALIAWIRK